MFSVFLGMEDSTVEDKAAQKIGRACSIQSKNEYKTLTRKSPVRPFVTAQYNNEMNSKQILRIWSKLQ
jgi:hypothetical protein